MVSNSQPSKFSLSIGRARSLVPSDCFEVDAANHDIVGIKQAILIKLVPKQKLQQAFDIDKPLIGCWLPDNFNTRSIPQLITDMNKSETIKKQYDMDKVVFILSESKISTVENTLTEHMSTHRTVIFFPCAKGERAISSATVIKQIHSAINLRDVFGDANPIVDYKHLLFGRQKELSRIISDLKRDENIGIFGLRKIGKTSILNAVESLIMDTNQGKVVKMLTCPISSDQS